MNACCRRDKSWLLQSVRFLVRNNFLQKPAAEIVYPAEGPEPPPLADFLSKPSALELEVRAEDWSVLNMWHGSEHGHRRMRTRRDPVHTARIPGWHLAQRGGAKRNAQDAATVVYVVSCMHA